jgi:hypothetical protein
MNRPTPDFHPAIAGYFERLPVAGYFSAIAGYFERLLVTEYRIFREV